MVFHTDVDKLVPFFKKVDRRWDARTAITRMKDDEYRHWKQMEWMGFYFQFLCEKGLDGIAMFPGPRFGNSEFDMKVTIPWDLKVHSIFNPSGKKVSQVILNDQQSSMEAIDIYGSIGLVLVLAEADFDNDSDDFKKWHMLVKGGVTAFEIDRIKRGAPSRKRKTGIRISSINLYLIDDSLLAQLGAFQEGMRNSDGSSRRSKFLLNIDEIAPIVSLK